MTIRIRAVRCPECGDDIYSRARHDFAVCSCGKVFVDGGIDPQFMRGGHDDNLRGTVHSYDLEIDASEIDLYNDWNSGDNKYGRITAEERFWAWAEAQTGLAQ